MFQEEKNSRRAGKVSAWGPLRHRVYRSLWVATVISNTGTWLQSTATAWLMTTLAPSSVMVALVQTAITLPAFLLALPAGALADVLDRRRLILFTQGWMLASAAIMGFLTITGRTTPWMLLALTLLLGLGAAMNGPAWQAIVPELVPRSELRSAVALNSAGFNVARSVGPALGGLVVGLAGAGVAFFLNAASYLGVMIVLFLWQRPPRQSALPAERIFAAMRMGIRYVRHAPALRAIFVRSAAFITCASVLLALLPLFARNELNLSSVGYGILLGSFGLGAVIGAAILPAVTQKMQVDTLIAATTVLFAAMLIALAWLHYFAAACGALILGGVAWLVIISNLNSSVHAVVPSWVRGRAMAVYMLIFFGGMALGSLLWGTIASFLGIPVTLTIAALGLIVGLAATANFHLCIVDQDLTPSNHWPVPTLALGSESQGSPVLVRIEYSIDPGRWREFGVAMRRLRDMRLRGGAMRWDLFVDAADPSRYVESFIIESWVEHLRQHERVTVSDREIEEHVYAFHTGSNPPRVTHYLARSLPMESG